MAYGVADNFAVLDEQLSRWARNCALKDFLVDLWRSGCQPAYVTAEDVSDVARRLGVPGDFGLPLVCDKPAATYERASDEHGRLGISGATNRLRIGDKIRLVPGHCDPDSRRPRRAARRITARGAVY